MKTEVVPDRQAKCVVCGKGVLEDRIITDRFDYPDGEETIPVVAEKVPVLVCTNCHETFSGPEAARIRHMAICRALGLLAPDEIRAIREGFGLSQTEFGRVTGIGEATISRWERGRLLQNKAMDRYLRLLARNPDHIRELKEGPNTTIQRQEASTMFELGVTYTRDEIHAALGGSKVAYLPTVGCRVVCACLKPDINPDAPRIVLVGDGERIEATGDLLCSQNGSIPVFLKRISKAWEFVGDYRVASHKRDKATIAEHARRSGRNDIVMVLELEHCNSPVATTA